MASLIWLIVWLFQGTPNLEWFGTWNDWSVSLLCCLIFDVFSGREARAGCSALAVDRDTALFFHLVGVVLFFSGMALAAAGLYAARRRTQTPEVVALLGLARWGALLVVAGAALMVGFGAWLVDSTAWSLSDPWLVWALALFAASVVLGALGGRRFRHARRAAEAGDEEALTRLLRDPVSDVLNVAAALAAFAVLALMVWKP